MSKVNRALCKIAEDFMHGAGYGYGYNDDPFTQHMSVKWEHDANEAAKQRERELGYRAPESANERNERIMAEGRSAGLAEANKEFRDDFVKNPQRAAQDTAAIGKDIVRRIPGAAVRLVSTAPAALIGLPYDLVFRRHWINAIGSGDALSKEPWYYTPTYKAWADNRLTRYANNVVDPYWQERIRANYSDKAKATGSSQHLGTLAGLSADAIVGAIAGAGIDKAQKFTQTAVRNTLAAMPTTIAPAVRATGRGALTTLSGLGRVQRAADDTNKMVTFAGLEPNAVDVR